jgi:CrcB protein
MTKLLLIALGGAAGSVARFGTGSLLATTTERTLFPWGTLAVNLLGCLLIGYLNGLMDLDMIRQIRHIPDEYRWLLVVGFLGGYTTFSTFGWESAALLRHGRHARAAAYILANNVIGIALVLAGYGLSRLHRG